ncbi:hypothetical protein TARUN_3900 [Trichoderma arundinaceum]|uniref:2EXR domain-containing protein n=1 Tax=Trichoderma arundinaceum TaxID=490622 RepID=A0A395NQU7_TRIAR|nr:hypothetical protein TARUN_3900 [Trichoderma arundinaceum]
MSTFHPFPRLPLELRARIWGLTAHPRLVHVRVKKHESRPFGVVCVTSPTPPPPVMQVCQESREYGPYRRAFTIGSEARYLWVNFESDMISLGDINLDDLESHQSDIQRLRFTVGSDESYDAFCYHRSGELGNFPVLKEIHVLVEEDILIWGSAFEDYGWGFCPEENIRFIDNASGLVLNGYQLLAALDFRVYYSWDLGGKVEDMNNLEQEIEIAMDDSHLTLAAMREIE